MGLFRRAAMMYVVTLEYWNTYLIEAGRAS